MTEIKSYPPIHLGSPGEDISKKDLHSVIQRFKNLNQLRQQRVQRFLQPRQQIFLDILPLLFHQNHPLFPGFVSSEAVAGIPDYHANKQAIHAAKIFSKGFTFKRRALLKYPIHSIFLMGSVSSIAFSKTSDMDIWLCHQPGLHSQELDELHLKATKIEQWAASYELEVHFFLVNSEQFSKGHDIPMSEESSGSTQHYLLLEEFYRTAIFIAGRIPGWWLVPPHQEHNHTGYINHLVENRFISENDIIDFGGLESIPAQEFISATLWHIYKSLNSPHKSLLKLFLMECYANEYPQPQWLCFELKTAIYQGTFDIDSLDPYLLIYLKVEKYLLDIGSIQRLNLVRHCFYLKIMGSSSKELDYHSRTFREDYLHSIATRRHWPDDLLSSFTKQKNWDIKKAAEEHSVVRTQLKHSLRIILGLAGKYVDYNYRENKDLKLIGRKLHTFLERKPGKIEIITTRATVHATEDELSIVESKDEKGTYLWSLYTGKFNEIKLSSHALIKQTPSLLDLLGWLVTNRLYKKQLRLHFESSTLKLSKAELHQILNQLFQLLSKNLENANTSLDVYNKPDKLLTSLIFINLGISNVNERDDGMLILSDRSDPLSYGQSRLNFIQKIDRISVSSWGEITTFQYFGLNGFFACLTDIFNNSQQPITNSRLKITCSTPIRANSIVLRAQAIFKSLATFFSTSTTQNVRYFLPGEHFYYVFQRQNNRLQFWMLETEEQLLSELAAAQHRFSAAHFDAEILENTIIPYIYTLNREQIIQLFLITENNSITIFIVDEKGSLFTQEHKQSDYDQVLSNYSVFLESIVNHSNNNLQLKFYEIKKKPIDGLSSELAKWTASPTAMDLSLKITIEDKPSDVQSTIYYVYCNDIEFSSLVFGTQLFEEVSRYILNFRKNKDHYPVHISDIDVPCSYLGVDTDEQIQTIHFLNYKKKIELKFNI